MDIICSVTTGQGAWFQVGTCRSIRTFHSTDDLYGTPSRKTIGPPSGNRSKRAAYEDTSAALSRWTFTAKALDLAIRVYFVVLEDGHLDLLVLVLDLLGGLWYCG